MLLHRDVTWRRWRKIAMSMGSSMGWTSKRLRSEGRGGRPRLVLGNGPRYMICVTHFCTLRELKNLRPCENRVRFLHGSRCDSRMAVRFWLAQRAKACDASGASGLPNSTLSVPTIPATSTHPNAGPSAVPPPKLGDFPLPLRTAPAIAADAEAAALVWEVALPAQILAQPICWRKFCLRMDTSSEISGVLALNPVNQHTRIMWNSVFIYFIITNFYGGTRQWNSRNILTLLLLHKILVWVKIFHAHCYLWDLIISSYPPPASTRQGGGMSCSSSVFSLSEYGLTWTGDHVHDISERWLWDTEGNFNLCIAHHTS